nr:unnamed protein product [Callosobruchus analis]
MKEEKELKPASMRVRDAAEHLLSCVLEQVSYFPSECGPESISSLLDELSLLKHCNTWPTDCSDQSVAVERFRYFVTEGSVMLALLEEPLGNDQHEFRRRFPNRVAPTGQTFRRLAARLKETGTTKGLAGRGCHRTSRSAKNIATVAVAVNQETSTRWRPTQLGITRRTLARIFVKDLHMFPYKLMGRQAAFEASIAQTQHSSTQPECIPPPVCHEFQTARLFLSHFGLLSLDETQVGRDISPPVGEYLVASRRTPRQNRNDMMVPRTFYTGQMLVLRLPLSSRRRLNLETLLLNIPASIQAVYHVSSLRTALLLLKEKSNSIHSKIYY